MALDLAIASMKTAKETFLDGCMTVWKEIERMEPMLVQEIRQLGFSDEQAAAWLCTDPGSGTTPAELVLAGRSSELVARIRQTMHGMGA